MAVLHIVMSVVLKEYSGTVASPVDSVERTWGKTLCYCAKPWV